MATYVDFDRVQYKADLGVKAPLCRLHFCRHCMKLRSTDCVSHEIDSHYCPHCFENMSPAEAKLKKNKCASCFECPSCFHTLSTRATGVPNPGDDPSRPAGRKVYYMGCGFCRWTTKVAGIPNQTVGSGAWSEKENPSSERINTLVEYFQQLAAIEKQEKDKKKFIRRKSFIPFSEKFGLSSSRKRASINPGLSSLSLKENPKVMDIEPAAASDEIEELSDEFIKTPLKINEITTLKQRLATPHFQPIMFNQLHPRHKSLLTQRSLRCKECEHNVIKPEFNPCSIKYRIQLVAIYHVPEIRLFSQPNLEIGKETQVILTLLNPFDYAVTVNVQDLPDAIFNAELSLPKCDLNLPPRDETAEFDDTATGQEFQDDSSVVTFRKSNKLGFFIKVTPKPSAVGARVVIPFQVRYNYRNMTASSALTDPTAYETVYLHQSVFVDLGDVNSSGA